MEKADPARLAAVALQWAGSSTEPKSWVHIGVFLGGPVDLLTSLTLPANVRLYDCRDLFRLVDDLDELVARLIRLLRHYADVSPDSSVNEAVKNLAASTLNWPKGKPDVRISYEAVAELPEGGLCLFVAESEEDEDAEVPVLKPSRKVVPLEVSSGGSSFEGALIRLTEAKGGQLLFSSEHRNYPFILRFTVCEGGGPSTLDLWFDVDKSNVPQVLEFWSLVAAVESSEVVILLDPSGEMVRFTLKGRN